MIFVVFLCQVLCVCHGLIDLKLYLLYDIDIIKNISLPTWISNYIYFKVWDEITYSLPNFNDTAG